MTDNEKITKLYESISRTDYFELNEKDFDFDKFITVEKEFLDYSFPDVHSYLLEDFKEVESNDKNKDSYLVKLHNGLQFNLHLRYFSSSDAREFVDIKKTSAEIKGDNQLNKDYVKSFSDLKEDQLICLVMFTDQEERTDRTGEVKTSAKELFYTLKKGILHSWSKRGQEKIKSLIMRVNKNDSKRLEFYKLLIQKFLPNFPNVFEDRTTEIKEGNILLIASK